METKIAVLIDADNTNSSSIEKILCEISKFGKIIIKRIYADWTSEYNKKWKNILNSYAITPIQKFSYTSGKNSTDTALIINAMDLLHTKKIDTFCIVSSDSDYTGLANRIMEEGMGVIGIGKKSTPEAFKASCETFILIDELNDSENINSNEQINSPISNNNDLIKQAFKKAKNINGQILLSCFANALREINPSFDHKSSGHKKFKSFCEQLNGYEVYTNSNDQTLYYIKEKNCEESIITENLKNNKVFDNYNLIKLAFENTKKIDNAALLSRFAESLRKIDSSFNHKHYGFKSFKQFCEQLKGYKLYTKNDKTTLYIQQE